MGVYTNRLNRLLNGMFIVLYLATHVIGEYKSKGHDNTPIIPKVPKCKPELSEGRDSKLEIHGYTFLECDFETCCDVYNITYVRKFEDSETWVVVFDGVNAPLHHKHGNNHAYSLTNRTRYAPFDTQHILSINPLLSEDEGDWRCVVNDTYGNLVMSQTMKIDMETKCNPEISEGLSSKLEKAGHVSFECDICGDFNKISFDKKSVDDHWKSVYVANTTHNHTTYASIDGYSIENRTRYVVFSERHILNINPLRLTDEGKWRCVTFHRNNIRAESNSVNVNIVRHPVKGTINKVPDIKVAIKTETLHYQCEIDKNLFEPPVVWMLNGTYIYSGEYQVYPQDDAVYVKSVLILPKTIARNSTIGCEVKYKGKSGQWTWNTISVDIEDVFKYDDATQVTTILSNMQSTFIVLGIISIMIVLPLMIALCCLVKIVKQLIYKTGRQQNSAQESLLNVATEDSADGNAEGQPSA